MSIGTTVGVIFSIAAALTGSYAIPSMSEAAHDTNAITEVLNIRELQGVAVLTGSGYLEDFTDETAGILYRPTVGIQHEIVASEDGYVLVVYSASDNIFLASSANDSINHFGDADRFIMAEELPADLPVDAAAVVAAINTFTAQNREREFDFMREAKTFGDEVVLPTVLDISNDVVDAIAKVESFFA